MAIKSIAAVAFGAILCASGVAYAADMAPSESSIDWSGPYIGLHGSYNWGDSDAEYTSTDIVPGPNVTFAEILASLPGSSIDMNGSGFMGGGQIGYNSQFDNNVVLGVEADFSFGNVHDKIVDDIGNLDLSTEDYVKSKSDMAGSVRARLGYAMDAVLIYATGGLAWTNAKVSSRDYDDATNTTFSDISDSANMWGWTVGAGAEFMLTEKLSAKAEYLYTDFGSTTFFEGDLWESEADTTSQSVRFGLNYHF
ncbi:MAG: outer membrane protein [Aestuariivirga sp.]